MTVVISSAEADSPSLSAAQEVAAAAWRSFCTDWAFEASATVAFVRMVTWPTALAIAVEFPLPEDEVEVLLEVSCAPTAALGRISCDLQRG